MKSICKGLLLFLIIAIVSLMMPGMMDSTVYSIQAGEAEWSDEETPQTDTDTFTVVEITPYRGMAEIGYLVGGQEPIDQELMDYNSAGGAVSFLGGAIDVYRSYEEKALPASGTAEDGWVLGRSETLKNGYFEYVGNIGYENGARYTLNTYGETYTRVPDGTGSYEATLMEGTDMDACYTSNWEPTNKKNVNAYFTYGKPAGVAIFNASYSYEPYSVKGNPTHTGDYDYNVITKTFTLNQGKGKYDVIFVRSGKSGQYYILKDKLEIVDNGTGEYSFPLTYVAKTSGNYVRDTAQYFAFSRWSGNYRFVQSDDALTKPTNYYKDSNNRVWVKNQRIMLDYEFHYNVQLVNNEWFKTKSLGIAASQVDNYPVKVVTITPDNLNKPENQHYIDEADLFYINANYNHNNSYIMLYELYSQEGRNLPESEKYYGTTKSKPDNLNFALHDLSWDNVNRIFKRAAGIGCNKAAMIIDDTYYSDAINGSGAYASLYKQVTVPYSYNGKKATMCNLAKLYIMVYQRNMIDFYNAFMQTDNPAIQTKMITQVATTINKTGNTGSFVRPDMVPLAATADAAIYWNGDTFLPYGLDANGNLIKYTSTSDMYANGIVNYNITATPTDLTNNILSTNGMDIFTAKFIQPLSVPSDSQEEAVVHLSSQKEDGTIVSAGNITIGDLANVITNNGQSYENVGGISYPDGSVVEGPPADSPAEDASDTTDDGMDGSGIRSYKRVLNIQPTADFTASEAMIRSVLSDYSVQIVNMTSTQFNGKLEDINTMYDMIYLGSSAGRYNLSGSKTTVFNNANLNGSYYLATGDTFLIKDNNRQIQYFRGNDITAQRMSDLEDYLDAGFPIVLDPTLYQATGINNSINMKAFISGAKSSHPANFLNSADNSSSTGSTRITFKTRLRTALDVIRPLINLASPVVAEDATTNYVYVDPLTDLLSVQFSLLPKGKYPSSNTYNAYLYLDESGDGIFDQTELLDVISSDGSSNTGLAESRYHTYKYNYNLAAYNGVYQWKLELRRSDNEEIRSSVTGYTANTNKENIYVLQIRESTSAYSMESRVNNAASLIYMYAGQNKLTDYNIIFDTLTIQEFQQLYATAPYTTATAAQRDKLAGYNLLIMDNPITAISTTNGARTNIKDEIAKGLSVIYTKDALTNDNQSYYYSSANYSFLSYLTYNFLNLSTFTQKNNYFIYNSLSTNGTMTNSATYNTNYVTKSNEGPITRYPYQINQAVKGSVNSFSDYVTADFSLTGQKLIGWYCLSDAKSPVVRSAYNTGVADADLYKGIYSSSPNDVKNNYYLFSNGLCYYSGISLAKADVSGNDEEIKLFVNTMIAAYQASDRLISSPPVIKIIDPVPVVAPDFSKSITITEEDITGTDFILTFQISQSSSKMDMSIAFNGFEPAGSWDDTIYEVGIDGSLGTPVSINNTSKVVDNKTYAVKIPVSELSVPSVLSFTIANSQGNVTSDQVTLIYVQKPVVTIENPELITNTNNSKAYLYLDIDFNALDTDEDYLNNAEDFIIDFKVEKYLTDFTLAVTSEGDSLTDGAGTDVSITPNGEDPAGVRHYIMEVPVALMKGHNSREITITATDTNGNAGQASVTLIRRSLFPLD